MRSRSDLLFDAFFLTVNYSPFFTRPMIIDNPSDVHKSNKVVVYAQFLLQWLSSANQFE